MRWLASRDRQAVSHGSEAARVALPRRKLRRVHEDVETLVSAGFLDRDATGLHADYGSVRLETLITL